MQIQCIKINIVSESPFLYVYDAPYFFNQLFWYFYNNTFEISDYIVFWQSQAINIKCNYKNKLCTTFQRFPRPPQNYETYFKILGKFLTK